MSDVADIRGQFARMMQRPEAGLDLARAALLVAAESDPALDPARAAAELADWGDQLDSLVDPEWNSLQRLACLRKFVYEELRFRGDRHHYFDPQNPLLDRVMERRLGIPLTMAIVLLELGWRVNMPLEGVGLPGHFLVRLTGLPQDLLLDPFDHAATVTHADAGKLLAEATGGTLSLEAHMLRSIGKREMVARLLANLKMAFLRAGDLPQALSAVERLRLVRPRDTNERRDQGLLLYELDRLHEARTALEEYLRLVPDASDREAIESRLLTLGLMLGADD